jgi:hypothetical protein
MNTSLERRPNIPQFAVSAQSPGNLLYQRLAFGLYLGDFYIVSSVRLSL